jgi:hypothetical protein
LSPPSVVYIIALFLTGCGRQADRPSAHSQPGNGSSPPAQAIQSMRDLGRVMTPGITTNAILTRLGAPLDSEQLPNGVMEWRYLLPPFPAEGRMRAAYVIGARLEITNGCLARVNCTYMSAQNGGKQEVLLSQTESGQTKDKKQPSPALKLFIVSSESFTNGDLIDTHRFPKLGYVSQRPTLAVSVIKEAAVEEHAASASGEQTETGCSFTIFLTSQDASLLKSITATNTSKRVLIMVGNELVAAPFIVAPLETGSFMFECHDRPLIESVKDALRRMDRGSQ